MLSSSHFIKNIFSNTIRYYSQGCVQFNLQTAIGSNEDACRISKWFVSEGTEVRQFDKICEIHSNNTIATITSPYHGLITKLYKSEGDKTPLGTSLMEINLYEPSDVDPTLEFYNSAYSNNYSEKRI